MLFGIQILGMLFGLFMIFLTFLHFKKKSFGAKSLIVWGIIWMGFIFVVLFPSIFYSFMSVLDITRTIDLFVVFGFFFFTVVIFYMYGIVKKSERKVENLVRKLAIEKKRK
ncbi:DUF2304 domain-containing protein [Candidatus Woesearchaeota archaeon]|nr:DUF2304 domain-containing protein [Candidatus Woesearchaeota archaeon]